MNRNLKRAHRLGVSLWTGMILNLSSGSGLEEIHFSRDVLPILSDHCFQCHGPDAKEGRKGDLRLDVEADAKRQRAGYQVIKSGDPQGSELIRRLTTSDPDERMPPPDHVRRVSPDQIQLLTRWIAEGAHWGQHWAFEPIVRPETSGLEANPIDELVARRLEKAGIPATALAPAEMRIRRVHLDLTGLPPDPDEAAEFVKAPTPEAWDRVVDKVLASEHFGERLAWDWLEAARYADTNGYQGDGERTMWPWRDWVVRAYNENVPFD
ncbi:MAG: DUF1549 domain-containing protein, partial [Verrucomicrobia bacterium]|nr:DUF1549 domain-containing protein [Verrucomicrobiota bacterium]